MAVGPAAKRHAAAVVAGLHSEYPAADCALEHADAFQLLIATILSAQCTDERVNQVTPELFRRYPTAAHLAKVPLETLEKVIHSTGFFRNKARNIQGCCQQLVEQHGGQVPTALAALVALPGVGRKTANVVLGTAFGLATGVVVDTHVTRLSERLGLTKHTDAEKIERDLMNLLPESEWIEFAHRMIHHGRRVCGARKPLCETCSLRDICPRIGVAAAGLVPPSSRATAGDPQAKRRGEKLNRGKRPNEQLAQRQSGPAKSRPTKPAAAPKTSRRSSKS